MGLIVRLEYSYTFEERMSVWRSSSHDVGHNTVDPAEAAEQTAECARNYKAGFKSTIRESTRIDTGPRFGKLGLFDV